MTIQFGEVNEVWTFETGLRLSLSTPPASYPHWSEADPFPCYSHDRDYVGRAVESILNAGAPDLADPVYLFLGNHEDRSRTNAYTFYNEVYGEGGKREGIAYGIYFQGKRIPPHPAMTRHLVAHEYGHAIEYAIARSRSLSPHSRTAAEEYMAVRGLIGYTFDANGGRWHSAIGELFADDFRILICGFEVEYWPHPGFAHPHQLDSDVRAACLDWWEEQFAGLHG